MSKYTTMLRYPIEQYLDNKGYNHKESNWKHCYKMLGLFDYPIFDELYRETLNNKIIRAYYFREIGFETFGQFRWQLRRTMHEIMPYYNQLYESEKIIIEPLLTKNMDYTEQWTRDELNKRDSENTANTQATSNSDDKNIFQDTPMNGLDTGAIERMDYATNVTFDSGTTETNTNSTTNNSSNYVGDYEGTKIHNEKGFDKSQADLLLTYRKTFLNIDLEVVESLNILFMGLW